MVEVPSPTGPVPRDPNDPDFWEWDDVDSEPMGRRRQVLRAVVAATLVVLLVLLILASVL